ncbi:hypothetical protein [Jannaschia aquimarina]|uniref:Uncharacterized protein n=1 Tax=Jannaschia aquimarina TaxID=935700 RepID=A0A0D1CL21_9RHOB|nr:hypothetical protein [Jannaschia aquimarina]KIT15492.1 hypothetical protein jaqu_27400 [Jannaschia aquimarina]SNT34102.1 hypothetical protein SAMN05421775_11221 [Jannaschia aquimarina]
MSFLNRLFRLAPSDELTVVTARLNAKVQPLDRGEIFEDPLADWLKSENLGDVLGGGTQLIEEPFGIEFCDVEIGLSDASDDIVARVVAKLEELRAPKGSTLLFDDEARPEVAFGRMEGLSLALNGTDLPEEVYANSDVNELIRMLDEALGDAGEQLGHWEGSRETMLYFYGPSYAEMERIIRPITDARPDTQLSRIEKIA